MRFCQCILGHNGKCCQDQSGQQYGFGTTTNTLVASQTYNSGQPRRVRKSILGGWTVTNHPMGTQSFPTWREAMEYARATYYLMNSSVA